MEKRKQPKHYPQRTFNLMSYATIATVVISAAGTAYTSYTKGEANKKLAAQAGTQKQQGFYGDTPTPQMFSDAQNQVFGNAAKNAMAYAPLFTQQNIDLQNMVTPGSSAQREQALQTLNQEIAGQIPIDVQQNIQRSIAQGFGGGYNPFTKGGQAPSAFARNLGLTSYQISQQGLSAAPTWQQLANSMVTRPDSLMGYGISAAQIGNQQVLGTSQLGQEAAQNTYQANANQTMANNLNSTNLLNSLLSIGGMGASGSSANSMAGSYGSNSSGQGASNTSSQTGGLLSALASLYSNYSGGSSGGSSSGSSDLMSSLLSNPSTSSGANDYYNSVANGY